MAKWHLSMANMGTETFLRLANYCADIADYCVNIAEHGPDGIYLSLGIFDDHKFYIKQTLSWLNQNKTLIDEVDKLILRFSRIIAVIGQLLFLPNLDQTS